MADKIKKYLTVVQSNSYSSEFKDLASEQLLQFCDPRKSPQSARNYLKLCSELLSEPQQGTFKRQHLNLIKGVFKYYMENETSQILTILWQAILEDKDSGLLQFLQETSKDKSKEKAGFTKCFLSILLNHEETIMNLCDENDIKLQEIIDKCSPLLGEKLHKEDINEIEPKKLSVKKPKKTKSRSKSKSGLDKIPLDSFIKMREVLKVAFPSKSIKLELKEKHKKTELGTEIMLSGQVLIEDFLFKIYKELVARLLSENWYTRHTTAVILKELLNVYPYTKFAHYYICTIEVNLSTNDTPFITISELKPISYDAKTILQFNKDLVGRIISGIIADHFTDYLDNNIATPVRESFGHLLTAVLALRKNDELFSDIVNESTKIIKTQANDWMSRYNSMLILRYFATYWKSRDILAKIFESIKEPLLVGLSSEDEIRVIACKLLKKCRKFIIKDHEFYLSVVKSIFDNIKTTDDIECSAVDMLILLEKLFDEDNSLIKNAIHFIDLKLIFVFCYHKLEGVRTKVFSLLFKLIEQLFSTHMKKTVEKSNPQIYNDLLPLLKISIQNSACENSQELLKIISKGFDILIKILDPKHIFEWYKENSKFLLKMVADRKITDFSQFSFYQTEQSFGTTTYYSFIAEPVTNLEITHNFANRSYYLTKLYASLSGHCPKVSEDLLNYFCNNLQGNPILLGNNTTISFYFLYWLVKYTSDYSTKIKELINEILNKSEFVIKIQENLDSEELNNIITAITAFSYTLPEAQQFSDLALADIQNDCTNNLEKCTANLKKLYQTLKDQNADPAKQSCAAALLLQISKLQDFVEYESNNIKAISSSILIKISRFENCLPEKLNPIIKPLAAAAKKSLSSYVLKISGKALAELEYLNSKNCGMNEKITSLIFEAYLTSLNSTIQFECISQFAKRYIKVHTKNSFKANNNALQKYSLNTLAKCIKEKNLTDANIGKQCLLELQFLQDLTNTSIKPDMHMEFLYQIFETLLNFIHILADIGKIQVMGDKENLTNIENIVKSLLITIVKIIGKESYEFFTLEFIKIISEHNFSGTRILSGFIIEIPKEYMPYLPYYILPVIRNFSSYNIELSELSYQLFSNILKILPINDTSLFSNVPKLSHKSAENTKIEAEGREGVQFLKSFLTTEQKYDYKIIIPLKGKLREYQTSGISWMAFMHKYNINCALCDDMGLGKTVQALVLMANEIELQGGCSKSLPSLVICPTTLMKNWLYEIPKFFDEKHLKGKIYSGINSTDDSPSPIGKKGKVKGSSKIFESGCVIITSYERARADIEELRKHEFFYIILDEAHVIRNSKAKVTQSVKQLRGQRKLILSGSPLHNNVTEIWSLFDFLNPGFLGSEQSFEQTYTKHLMTNLKKINEKTKETTEFTGALEGLKQRIAPFILRRTKQDVLKDLPPKIMQDYNCKTSPIQKLILAELNQLHPLDCKPGTDEKELMLERIQWHLYLSNHPKLLIRKAIEKADVKKNPIISLDLLNQIKKEYQIKQWEKLGMEHSGKMMSLKQLLIECGILTDEMIKNEQNNSGMPIPEPENGNNSKIITELIEAPPSPHRALIFCQKITMLDILEKDFLKQYPEIKYLRLDSQVEPGNRVDLARKFNEDQTIPLMLLTTKVGGYGLTLTGADTVIFYDHDWNPMNDLQAMDRTHRIGQTRTVNVYRLILLGTIEERVMNIQKFKQNLAKSLIENEKTTTDKLKLQDMFESFVEKADSSESKKKKGKDKISYVDEIAMKWAEIDKGNADDLE